MLQKIVIGTVLLCFFVIPDFQSGISAQTVGNLTIGTRVPGDRYLFSACNLTVVTNTTTNKSVLFFVPNVNITVLEVSAIPVNLFI